MSECLTLGTDWAPEPWASGLTQDEMPQAKTRPVQREAGSALVGSGRREKEFRDCLAAVKSYQTLPVNWDKYGGLAACPEPLDFADKLLRELAGTPTANVSAPVVRPISGGVYLEWRLADAILYFEADDESVLEYSRTAVGEQTTEDPEFDWERAYEIVKTFYDNAA